METLIFIFVGFITWLYAAKFINDNYQRSRGLSSLFWLILLLGTVSFLFGSSSNTNTLSGSSEEGNNHSNYDDDNCYKNSWDSDDSCDFGWGGGGGDDSSYSFVIEIEKLEKILMMVEKGELLK